MSHTPNMYGSNLKEYAQNVLDNKQIAEFDTKIRCHHPLLSIKRSARM
jgi:hypothetical protein